MVKNYKTIHQQAKEIQICIHGSNANQGTPLQLGSPLNWHENT